MQTPGFGTPCIPKHPPQGSGRGGALPAPSPAAPLLPLSRFIYTSYLNNSHCLLFSVNVPPKRPTMSYCSHQMGSRMQQVGQMAKRPVWGCWLRQGLPFSSRYLIIILHRALCSLGVGSKWGAGKACTHTTRGLRAHKLPAPPNPHAWSPPIFGAVALCFLFFHDYGEGFPKHFGIMRPKGCISLQIPPQLRKKWRKEDSREVIPEKAGRLWGGRQGGSYFHKYFANTTDEEKTQVRWLSTWLQSSYVKVSCPLHLVGGGEENSAFLAFGAGGK